MNNDIVNDGGDMDNGKDDITISNNEGDDDNFDFKYD